MKNKKTLKPVFATSIGTDCDSMTLATWLSHEADRVALFNKNTASRSVPNLLHIEGNGVRF